MIRFRIAGVALALSFIGAAGAQTAQSELTRAQVRAELVEAQRLGEIPAGEVGRTPREISPNRYPVASVPEGLTRAEVVAQLKQARRDGDFEVGETGRTEYELVPRNFPQRVAEQGLTRDEVRAEYRDARRTGDLVATDEIGEKLNERFPGRYAKAKSRSLTTTDQVAVTR